MLDGPSLLDSGISTTEWTIFKIGENAIVTLTPFFLIVSSVKPGKFFQSGKKLLKNPHEASTKLISRFFQNWIHSMPFHSFGIFDIGKIQVQITGLV